MDGIDVEFKKFSFFFCSNVILCYWLAAKEEKKEEKKDEPEEDLDMGDLFGWFYLLSFKIESFTQQCKHSVMVHIIANCICVIALFKYNYPHHLL